MKTTDYAELDLDRLTLEDAIELLAEMKVKFGGDAIINISEWSSLEYEREETSDEKLKRVALKKAEKEHKKRAKLREEARKLEEKKLKDYMYTNGDVVPVWRLKTLQEIDG